MEMGNRIKRISPSVFPAPLRGRESGRWLQIMSLNINANVIIVSYNVFIVTGKITPKSFLGESYVLVW
jgi:hypothetical protein